MATVQRVDAPRKAPGGENLDRQPPRNLEAERAVLGSILLLPDCCDDVALVLTPDDFYDPAHQKLFAQMLAMHDAGGRIDITLLVDRLRKAGELELVGGMAYLAEIAQAVPTAAHAAYYAEIVRDKGTLRALIHAGTDIVREAYDDSVEARAMLSRAEEKVFGILDQRGVGQLHSITDILHSALQRIDARMKNEQALDGVETGFSDLDTLTGGMHNSELIIIAARPSMGKTAFAMNLAEHAAIDRGCTTLFVSLEMSSLELADRLLCSRAKINGNHLRNGSITNDERRKLLETTGDISESPLFVDDSPSRTMTEIAATARRLKRRNQLGLIVIDYLQLIEPDNARDPRQEQVARIARRLKGLARELKVPVICLAQLNRQTEASKDNRPRLSHLRESGAIEQDADVVMFVHREEYYLNDEEDKARVAGQADIIIAKQRNGPIGDVKLCWLKQFTRFENLAAERHGEFDRFNGPGDF
ncbi:MAG TPA: replicative DNA helicase [Pirellulales bacterium]|jgi:replicative DNA helicase|nr:replicative DNA helicase [Pirellulales bacterium]